MNDYLSKLFSLEGKIAVITGGLGKLGAEYTEALLCAGAKVATIDITDEPGETLKNLEGGYPLKFFKADITNEESIHEMFQRIEDLWGTPNVLINNAGWKASPTEGGAAGKPFEEYSIDLWEHVFSVNLTGAAICAKEFGNRLIKQKKPGVIINVASTYGITAPIPSVYEYKENKTGSKFYKDASYGSSKAALIALTRELAVQWAPYGIRVVALSPGGVFNPKSDPAFVKAYSEHTPLGRMADKSEYNGAIVFLASDASSYMTGSNLIVDGGWTAW